MNFLAANVLEPSEPNVYPTKEDILAERPMFKWGVFKVISEWKLGRYPKWAEQPLEEKRASLYELGVAMSQLYGVKPPLVMIAYALKHSYYQKPGIIWTHNGSIISFLHELGHHLFGPGEIHACRFSVWIYKLRFTSAMKKLVWHGHLLQEK